MHCLSFICERKFYARTPARITRQCKSTLSLVRLVKSSAFGKDVFDELRQIKRKWRLFLLNMHRRYQIVTVSVFTLTTAAWLAQLGERRSAEWEVAGSNPGRTSTQGPWSAALFVLTSANS